MDHVALIISIITLFIGSGGIGTLLLRLSAHNRKQAVQEYRLNETATKFATAEKDIYDLRTQLALTNQNFQNMGRQLDKLDLIETIHAKMEIMTKVIENVIPRPEAEAKFSAVERRVEVVENELHKND